MIVLDLARLAVTLGHLALIQLILGSLTGRWLLRPFEAAGRIPLTIYLFTSLVMMWVVFAPWGFDLFGAWGQAQMLGFSLLVIAAELVAANLWLRHFDNGPAEWLWKSLAYQRREPFRKVAGRARRSGAFADLVDRHHQLADHLAGGHRRDRLAAALERIGGADAGADLALVP